MVEENKKKIIDDFHYLENNEDEEFYDTEENEIEQDDIQDEYNEILIQTANQIQNNLFDYVSAYGLPLCENLTMDTLIRFIEKVN